MEAASQTLTALCQRRLKSSMSLEEPTSTLQKKKKCRGNRYQFDRKQAQLKDTNTEKCFAGTPQSYWQPHISEQVCQKLALVQSPHAGGTDNVLNQFHSIPCVVLTSSKLTRKPMRGINRV